MEEIVVYGVYADLIKSEIFFLNKESVQEFLSVHLIRLHNVNSENSGARFDAVHGQFSVSAPCTGPRGPQSQLIAISSAAIGQNLPRFHRSAFQVIIYQHNESIPQHRKGPSFIFAPRARLI